MRLDPRIGMLNSGRFYCFPNGNGQPEFAGTLEEVEVALGLRPATVAPVVLAKSVTEDRLWAVRLTFQYPAWDEVNGLEYPDIPADGKSEANAIARRRASDDGHLCGGKGRVTFTAIEQRCHRPELLAEYESIEQRTGYTTHMSRAPIRELALKRST